MIEKRNVDFQLYGSIMPDSITMNDKVIPYEVGKSNNNWNYSGSDFTVHIHANQPDCSTKLKILVYYTINQVQVNGLIGKMHRLKKTVALLKNNWFDGSPIPDMMSSTNQVETNIEYHPSDFDHLVSNFNLHYTQIGDTINNTFVNKAILDQCHNYLENK